MVSSTAQSVYAEKLKDPRWQKKRLEIMARDGFMCHKCGSTTNTLHVHHMLYHPGKEPWEAPDCDLVTLCEWCHVIEGPDGWQDSLDTMICAIKTRMWAGDAHQLACSIGSMRPYPMSYNELTHLINLLCWLCEHPDDREWVRDSLLQHLHEKGDQHGIHIISLDSSIHPSPPCHPNKYDEWLKSRP